MRTPTPPPIQRRTNTPERMWTLDMSIAALAGLVLYLIVTRLRFDDPRWLFNGWTYAIAVPLVALALAFLSHGLVNRHVQKSIQLGFLFSVFVHLLLLILAVNVIIFSQYFPDAFSGVKPDRSPVRKTIPDYLFRTPDSTREAPDWSQPVEADTSSRVEPEEPRQLPPLERSAPRLELPTPRQPQQRRQQKFLMRRQQPSESIPRPAESPARLAARRTLEADSAPVTTTPTAPNVAAQPNVEAVSVSRETMRQRRSNQARAANPAAPAAVDVPLQSLSARSISGARSQTRAMPTIGQAGLRRQARQPSLNQQFQPAGSSPAPQSVAIARQDPTADLLFAPTAGPLIRQGRTSGAQLTISPSTSESVGLPSARSTRSGGQVSRNNLAARSGVPTVAPGNARRTPGTGRRQTAGVGFEPVGTLSPGQPNAARSNATAAISAASPASEDVVSDSVGDRLGTDVTGPRPSRPTGGAVASNISAPAMSGPEMDLLLPRGPAGLTRRPSGAAGMVPSRDQPEISSLDLARSTRPRREVGGPATPVGTKIAAVESFSRRVMRTKGGAAPTPAGMVGPATEEAIERGLAYLAQRQNLDGSWSLQGHGSDVLLRSDTAATGLCLLAFQGAGYTHQQHQYADTVGRGLRFLVDHQRTNGDLYRSENEISDRNVALYSHGIAALALCEAYGMTQDADLKDAAQASLNYIVNTQHRQRGGWRYTPQISADTSVTGWMMMALKSGQLSGLQVPEETYQGIQNWLGLAQSPERPDRYRYNPFAPDTPTQRHGRVATPTMTSVGMLMRMYMGWRRDNPTMQSAADYLLRYPPQIGTARSPQRDTYYWYYATQVMFHMGADHWYQWNRALNPLLVDSQIKSGPEAGSWDPMQPVPDRWAIHAGRLYVTAMNLLNLEVYYRHLPIYDDTAE